MGHPRAIQAVHGFDANERSQMGIICLLSSFNKHFLGPYALCQGPHGSVLGKFMKNWNW